MKKLKNFIFISLGIIFILSSIKLLFDGSTEYIMIVSGICFGILFIYPSFQKEPKTDSGTKQSTQQNDARRQHDHTRQTKAFGKTNSCMSNQNQYTSTKHSNTTWPRTLPSLALVGKCTIVDWRNSGGAKLTAKGPEKLCIKQDMLALLKISY